MADAPERAVKGIRASRNEAFIFAGSTKICLRMICLIGVGFEVCLIPCLLSCLVLIYLVFKGDCLPLIYPVFDMPQLHLHSESDHTIPRVIPISYAIISASDESKNKIMAGGEMRQSRTKTANIK